MPEVILAVIIMLSLTVYALLGGADYGAGIWDLLSFGPRKEEQQKLIGQAIAPVWEVNHVWLIFIIVLLFSGFPAVFAAITTALHIPILLVLVGVVFRGAAFTFRSYYTRAPSAQRFWARVFSVASLLTPIFLGVVIGALSSGSVQVRDGRSLQGFFADWASPFPIVIGLFAATLFAYLAAVYLTVEASDIWMQNDFRRRAILSGIAVAFFAGLTFLLSGSYAPAIRSGLLDRPWSWGEQIATAIAAIVAFWALLQRRFRLARFFAAAQVVFILWGWALAQYPYLVRPDLTITNATAPRGAIEELMTVCLVGAVIMIPSLLLLFSIFKGTFGPVAVAFADRTNESIDS